MYYALILRDGVPVGAHGYIEQPAAYPDNEWPCTAEQALNPGNWSVAGGEIVPAVVIDPVPPSITRRQCALELHARGLIGGDEAVAMAATATPPGMVAGLIEALPADEQVVARIDFAANTYERGNPLLAGLMSAQGAGPADIDDFFRAAAAR